VPPARPGPCKTSRAGSGLATVVPGPARHGTTYERAGLGQNVWTSIISGDEFHGEKRRTIISGYRVVFKTGRGRLRASRMYINQAQLLWEHVAVVVVNL
jgi:hypothetical protein